MTPPILKLSAPGPSSGKGVGPRGAGEDESAGPSFVVDSPLHSSENLGDHLPLIEQHRFVQAGEHGIWISRERGCFRDTIEPHAGLCVTALLTWCTEHEFGLLFRIGAVLSLDRDRTEGYVHSVAVHREYRHRGIARALLR